MRPTLLGSLLDAARHNVARNGPDVAIFESGTVYRARRRRTPRRARRRAPRPRRAAQRARSRRAPGAGDRPPADFFAAKALLARCSTASTCDWSVRAARVAVPAPGAAPPCWRATPTGSPRRSASSASCTRSSPASGTSSARPRSRSTSASSPRVAPEVVAFRRLRRLPAAAPGPRGDAARRRRGAQSCSHAVREAAGEMLERRARCSTSTPASRWGRAGARSRSRSRSARSSARSPTRTSRRVRERIVAALAELGGELRG